MKVYQHITQTKNGKTEDTYYCEMHWMLRGRDIYEHDQGKKELAIWDFTEQEVGDACSLCEKER